MTRDAKLALIAVGALVLLKTRPGQSQTVLGAVENLGRSVVDTLKTATAAIAVAKPGAGTPGMQLKGIPDSGNQTTGVYDGETGPDGAPDWYVGKTIKDIFGPFAGGN